MRPQFAGDLDALFAADEVILGAGQFHAIPPGLLQHCPQRLGAGQGHVLLPRARHTGRPRVAPAMPGPE